MVQTAAPPDDFRWCCGNEADASTYWMQGKAERALKWGMTTDGVNSGMSGDGEGGGGGGGGGGGRGGNDGHHLSLTLQLSSPSPRYLPDPFPLSNLPPGIPVPEAPLSLSWSESCGEEGGRGGGVVVLSPVGMKPLAEALAPDVVLLPYPSSQPPTATATSATSLMAASMDVLSAGGINARGMAAGGGRPLLPARALASLVEQANVRADTPSGKPGGGGSGVGAAAAAALAGRGSALVRLHDFLRARRT